MIAAVHAMPLLPLTREMEKKFCLEQLIYSESAFTHLKK